MHKPFGQPDIFWLVVVEPLLMPEHSDDRTQAAHGEATVATKSSIDCPRSSYGATRISRVASKMM